MKKQPPQTGVIVFFPAVWFLLFFGKILIMTGLVSLGHYLVQKIIALRRLFLPGSHHLYRGGIEWFSAFGKLGFCPWGGDSSIRGKLVSWRPHRIIWDILFLCNFFSLFYYFVFVMLNHCILLTPTALRSFIYRTNTSKNNSHTTNSPAQPHPKSTRTPRCKKVKDVQEKFRIFTVSPRQF